LKRILTSLTILFCTALLLVSFKSDTENKGCHVYGKTKFVEYGEDSKVKFVAYEKNLNIKYVEYGEDFKVKEVEYGEGC